MRATTILRSGTLVPQPGLLGVATSKGFADVWVVIAAYNEERAIELVLASLVGFLYLGCRGWGGLARGRASLVGLPYRVVVVDDGSTDGTAQVAGRAGAEVLSHPINLG